MSNPILYHFENMDNQLDTAANYANLLLSDMNACWETGIIENLLNHLQSPQQAPRLCVKALRVLHELTTKCTKVDLKRLVLTTNLLPLLQRILQLQRLRGTIKCCSLALLSNILVSGWRMRDAIVESGLLNELLQLLVMRHHGKQEQGQVMWLLYQMLRYKSPGIALNAISKIAEVLPALLSPSQDVELLLPALQLARLCTEYHSSKQPSLNMLSCVLRFVLSPVAAVQREAIFVVANVCVVYRRKKAQLYCHPKSILQHVHCLVLGGSPEIRVLVLHLLGIIINNHCIQLEYFVELGMLKKIVHCAGEQEQLPEVRIAAGWTLSSFALHLCHSYRDYYLESSAFQAICDLFHVQQLPVQLLRNILVVLLLLGEKQRHSRQCLLHVMWKSNTWPIIQSLQFNDNAAVKSLSTILTARHSMC